MKTFKLTKGIKIIIATVFVAIIGVIIVFGISNSKALATGTCSKCGSTTYCDAKDSNYHYYTCEQCSYVTQSAHTYNYDNVNCDTIGNNKHGWYVTCTVCAYPYQYSSGACSDSDVNGYCDYCYALTTNTGSSGGGGNTGGGGGSSAGGGYSYDWASQTQHYYWGSTGPREIEDHFASSWTGQGNGTHWAMCEGCNGGATMPCSGASHSNGGRCTECGDVYETHSEEILPAKAATCTSKGLTQGKKCPTCGVLEAQEEVPVLEHTYETKYDANEHWEECIKCGEDKANSRSAHTEKVTKVGKAATCEETGLTDEIGCEKCEIIQQQQTIPALGHSFTNYKSDNNATCTKDGTKTAKCDRCDKTNIITEEGSKLSHTEQIVPGVSATCTEDGKTEGKYCKTCQYPIQESEIIPALGHDYEEKITRPTCTEKGYTTHKCTRCNDSKIDTYTDALGHSYTNYESDNNATCTKDGTKTAKCDRCDETDTITEEGSMLPHTEQIVPEVPATCTQTGRTERKYCKVCQHPIKEAETIPALGHSYTNYKSDNNATCTADGTKTAKCDRCDETDTITEEGSKMPHTEQVVPEVPATCTQTGRTEGIYCRVCQHPIKESETIPALGHCFTNYESDNNATCTADGTKTAKCDRCDETDTITDEGSMLPHTEQIVPEVPATCTEDGKTEGIYCQECQHPIQEAETIPALGHEYEETVTDPTCTEKGYTTHQCTRCEDSYIDTYTDALEHSFTNYESDNNATCTADGTKTAKCDRCDETDTITEEGSMLPHTEQIVPEVPATCTADGKTEGIYCQECQHPIQEAEIIPALGHSFTNYESDKNATCTADGTKTAKCDRCDETDTITEEGSMLPHTEQIIPEVPATCTADGKTEGIYCQACLTPIKESETIPALGHNYEETVTNPTCTEKGYTTHQCTRCEDSYVDTYTDELGHSFTNYESDNNATCTKDGTKTAKCARCDETDTITDEESMLPHTEQIVPEVPATCTETGTTEGIYCQECQHPIKEAEIIPALGHDYEETITNPTCTEKGYTTHECTRCEDSYIDTYTDELGHSYTNYESDNNATCTADGTKTAKCNRCDETDTVADEESKLPHTEQIVAAVPATCTEEGLTEGKYCSVCEEVLVVQEIIPELGHTEVVDARIEPTCIESGLTEGKHCSVCEEKLVEQETIPALGHNYENGKCTGCGRDQYQQIETTSEKYEINDDYISNIQPGTSMDEFKSNIETTATEIKIYNKDDEEVKGDEKIGTGMRIELKNGDKTATYIIIITGDINGDGVANINDIFSINSHRLGVKLLTGVYLQAADVNNDKNVDVKDIFKINSYRLRGGEL